MVNLNSIESVKEQLAQGNKLISLKREIIIDLAARTKGERVRASVQRLMMPNLDDEPQYQEDAENWLETYLPNFTTITIKGRGGQIASLPYTQKDKMLDKIIKIFNS